MNDSSGAGYLEPEGGTVNLQTVILAGGRGSRLRPITRKIPKVMIPINGRPFLEYLLRLLKKNGFSEILLLVGYLGRQIEEYFGDGERTGLEIKYSYEDIPLGTGGALKKAEGLLSSEFLLVNGDTYLEFDYGLLISDFERLDGKGLICVYTNPGKVMVSNLLLDRDGRVTKYDKTNPEGLTEVDAGVGIFKKEVLNLIPENTFISLETRIYEKLIRVKKLYGFPVEKEFLDIGTPERLSNARRILK